MTREEPDPATPARPTDTDQVQVPLDFSAFHALYREAYMRRAERELRCHADAEEAVDATFEQLLMCWETVLQHEAPAAYAWLVLKHRIYDLVRARERRPALLDFAAFETATMKDTHDPIGDFEDNWALFSAIAQLAPQRQDVVLLRNCEGYTTSQVAALLGITEAGVRSAHRYALRQLRHLLDPEHTEGKGENRHE